MIDYDYLGWGSKVSPEDIQKKADYKELAKMDFFNTDPEDVTYEEAEAENNEYNVWFFDATATPWGDETADREKRRNAAKTEILNFVKEIGPGTHDWQWQDGTFLDAFLIEDVKNVEGTTYDSVLLLAPDQANACPLAVIWEMIPEEKRHILMNLQKAGNKIFACFSDRFKYAEDMFICLEVYIRK